ncbi:MAG TPA: hypothetical protein VHR84_10300 [Terriglobales bacterium]|nr:hypothetical protein [Terriglobales bacterium]
MRLTRFLGRFVAFGTFQVARMYCLLSHRSVGEDNLFKGEKYKWSVRFMAINITDEITL